MEGTAEIVRALFAAHRGELVAFAERRLGSRALAEDVVQQAAARALTGAAGLRDARAGRAWMFTITRRLVAEQARGRAEACLAGDPAMNTDDEFGCACILANLDHIKPDFAHVLRRVALDGAPLVVVAKELDLSLNAVTVRLSRARAALREQLRAHCGTSSLRTCLGCLCDERGCCSPKQEADLET